MPEHALAGEPCVLRIQLHRLRGRGRHRNRWNPDAQDTSPSATSARPSTTLQVEGQDETRRDHGPGPLPDGTHRAGRHRPDPEPRGVGLPRPTTKDVPHQLFAAMVETSVAPAAAGNEHRAERTWRTSECQCQLRLVGPGFDRARDLKLLPRNDCGWPGQAGAEQGCAHPGRGVARPRITDRSGVASVRST
jgi:hypothetical protein